MAAINECRLRHLTASFHIRRKKQRLLDLGLCLKLISESPGCKNALSIDGRHVLRLDDIQIDRQRKIAFLLVSCADLMGRDATYTNIENFARRRFPKMPREGVGTSAHLAISLEADPMSPDMHPAVVEEIEGLHRSNIEKFINRLIAEQIPHLGIQTTREEVQELRAPGSTEVPARFRLDIFADQDIRRLADHIRVQEVRVTQSAPIDSEYFMIEDNIVRLRVKNFQGFDEMKAAISDAWKRARERLPGTKHKMAMSVQRPDGKSVSIRVEDEKSDIFAEAFQKIDTISDFSDPLPSAPESLHPELSRRMEAVVKARLKTFEVTTYAIDRAHAHTDGFISVVQQRT